MQPGAGGSAALPGTLGAVDVFTGYAPTSGNRVSWPSGFSRWPRGPRIRPSSSRPAWRWRSRRSASATQPPRAEHTEQGVALYDPRVRARKSHTWGAGGQARPIDTEGGPVAGLQPAQSLSGGLWSAPQLWPGLFGTTVRRHRPPEDPRNTPQVWPHPRTILSPLPAWAPSLPGYIFRRPQGSDWSYPNRSSPARHSSPL